MITYNILFILLYAIGAYFSANMIAYHIMFDHPYHLVEIIHMFSISLALLAGHFMLYRYGQRKKYLTKTLMIILCCLDAVTFGVIFFAIAFFASGGGLLTYLEILFNISVSMSAFWILIIMVIHRIWITKRFFSRGNNKTD